MPRVRARPPSAVTSLLHAVGAGRVDEAARAFAGDALYAYWDGGGDETAPRTIVEGRDAIREVLEAAEHVPELLLCVHDGAETFLEGRLVDKASSEPVASFAVGLQHDVDGLVTRELCYHCPPIEPSDSWADPTRPAPGDGRAILDRYFEHLGAGRFSEAVVCFSEDCLYSHPPYDPGEARVEFRGHDELLAGLEKRGPRSWDHDILSCLQRGPDCVIEGVVPTVPGGGSFISSASLADDGRIRRYASFYCSPLVPRR